MKHFIYIVILFFNINSFSQVKNCIDFKNGTFKYSQKDYEKLVTVRIDSLQTDSHSKSGGIIKSRIKWLWDCEYEMEIIEVNKKNLKSLIGLKHTVRIIRIVGDRILCQANYNGKIVDTEMIKIE